jgi:hypothetical protein
LPIISSYPLFFVNDSGARRDVHIVCFSGFAHLILHLACHSRIRGLQRQNLISVTEWKSFSTSGCRCWKDYLASCKRYKKLIEMTRRPEKNRGHDVASCPRFLLECQYRGMRDGSRIAPTNHSSACRNSSPSRLITPKRFSTHYVSGDQALVSRNKVFRLCCALTSRKTYTCMFRQPSSQLCGFSLLFTSFVIEWVQ